MTKYFTLGLLITGSALLAAQSSFADSSARHVAFEACAQELGLQPPQPGQKPSAATMQKMDQCMEEKGYNIAQERSEMKACLQSAGVQLPSGGPSAWKNLDAQTKAAIHNCREQAEGSN